MLNYIDMVNNISLKIKHECMPRADLEERRLGGGHLGKIIFFLIFLVKLLNICLGPPPLPSLTNINIHRTPPPLIPKNFFWISAHVGCSRTMYQRHCRTLMVKSHPCLTRPVTVNMALCDEDQPFCLHYT